ncbi:saccharopine dehydrogenase-like oxidoreductase isoform X1 [Schistocerca nitens]|uniref:saccharopine dehydrogenase-like oxidoreductase isoform X1 n=2 Tax=Schistocerca nitens TaxID=7011 RepID=UPI0021189092|nr:saccharopine dehydrogenase-like oxidoreductase isoform X1 [Schistocerca nitens]
MTGRISSKRKSAGARRTHIPLNSAGSVEGEKLDLVIFGASGFTGKYTTEEALRLSKVNDGFTWGIAGRSSKKLKQILDDISKKTGEDLSYIPIIEADLQNFDSLLHMASRARVVVNCVGPYRFYGEPVVKACIESGAHQVDVTGEIQYIQKLMLSYNTLAEEKGVFIINACGFDCIPTDMGVVFLQNKFGGDINSVEAYLEIEVDVKDRKGPAIHFGTWESAIHVTSHYGEIQSLQRKLFPDRLPRLTPKLKQRLLPHRRSDVEGWCLPFPGTDIAVAESSQRHFYKNEMKRPVQFNMYFVLPSLLTTIGFIFRALLVGLLAQCRLGVKFLLKHPGMFTSGYVTHEDPAEEILKNTLFRFTLFAEGWKERLSEPTPKHVMPINKKVTVQIKGRNPAYGATCTALVLSAVTIIKEREKMPARGGVITTATAFSKTSLIKELHKEGLTFDVISVEEN